MKNIVLVLRGGLAVIALLLISTGAEAQTPAFDRAVACGSASGFSGAQQVAVDGQGNTLAAGHFTEPVLIGNALLTAAGPSPGPGLTPSDVFVAKLDAAGAYVWAVQAGGALWDYVTGVAADAAGDVYVTGYFESFSMAFGNLTLYNSSAAGEAYVAKLSGATGQWLWARRCGGVGPDVAAAVAVSAQGEVYVAGNTGGVADFGPITVNSVGQAIGFVAKLSPAGAWLWARPAGSGLFALSGLVLDAQNDIYLAGTFASPSVTFSATTLTTQPRPLNSSNFCRDLFVAKVTNAGVWQWATQGGAGTPNMVSLAGLAKDGLGHLYVAGSYGWQSARIGGVVLPNQSAVINNPGAPLGQVSYGSDAYVARLNAGTGAWEWAVRAGGGQNDDIEALAADAQGRVYVAGGYANGFANPLPGGGQAGLAQLDGATGAWRWARPRVPSVGVQHLALDGAGRVTVAGWFTSPTVAFGPVTLAHVGGPGGSTGYLARLGAGPLAAHPAAARADGLVVWPNPGGPGPVWVQGPAPGQVVQVLDALGRIVAIGQMPARGPLALPLPAALSAGLYLVRSAGQVQRLVIE